MKLSQNAKKPWPTYSGKISKTMGSDLIEIKTMEAGKRVFFMLRQTEIMI
jgi:hypothetical protein